MKEHGNPENQAEEFSRFGLHGDFPTRAMMWVLRTFPRMPRFIEAFLLHFFSLIVFLLAGPQRRAIRQNLTAIFDSDPREDTLGFFEELLAVYQVFVNFGWTYLDGLRSRLGQRVISWDIEGKEVFDQLQGGTEAALILTTHTGNYDLAAALFSDDFGRELHTVRIPEKTAHLEAVRRQEFAADFAEHPYFKVHYNESQNMLGVKLASLLSEGQLVALQCDRIVGEVSALEVSTSENWSMRIPKGPMTLAAMTKSPCIPLYTVRTGYRAYRVIFQPPLTLPEGRRLREPVYADAWTERLLPFLREYGTQWFAFEKAFLPRRL